MRRVFLVILLIAVGGAAVWTVLRWDPVHTGNADPWAAIPDQAAVIFEIPDPYRTWDRFTHSSLLWHSWETEQGAAALGVAMSMVAERIGSDPAFREALGTDPVLIALLRTGAGCADALLVGTIRVKDAGAIAGLFKLAPSDLDALKNGDAIRVRFVEGSPTVVLAIRDGLWMVSSSAELVEEARIQMERGTPLVADPGFAKARATMGGGTDGHVLVHAARAKGLLNGWWTPERLDRLNVPEGWTALDLRIQPDAILLSGLMITDGTHRLSRTIIAQGNGPWNVARVLPNSVSQWSMWNVRDAGDRLSSAEVKEEALFPWVHGAAGTASAFAADGSIKRWLVMETEDPDAAMDDLNARSGPDTLSYRGTRLSRWKEPVFWQTLMGERCALPEQPWWVLLGHTVLMSDDVNALTASIDVWNDGSSLAEDKRTMEWFQRQATETAYTWWVDPIRAQGWFTEGMRPAADSAFRASNALWAKHGGLCMQLSATGSGIVHVGIALLHASGEQPEGNDLWHAEVGAPILRRPDILLNHTNGTREVLVQDTTHRIHVIASTGKVLWSRALDGPIMGAVHQVDKFKNGKLQVLFNTATTCYFMDRNGKDMGGFPLRLKSAASAPIAVVDYDDTKDYRVLVPTKDGHVLNFSLDGAYVDGWQAPTLAAPGSEAVHHLRIRNKDYILVIDGNGEMKLLDRKGAEREHVDPTLERLKDVQAVIPGAELRSTRIQWLDQDLVLHETTVGGSELRTVPGGNGRLRFIDLDSEREQAVAKVVGDSLILLKDGKVLFQRSHGTPLDPTAMSFKLEGIGWLIGVCAPTSGKAWLLDVGGLPLPGMPVEGNTLFSVADLNLDGEPDLVIGNGSGVTAYRIKQR
ncbi:MAG: PQQ-binding-like beta-propeller repeat protein [Flavobacteriales bacterium]|nr:PQQ-binding-like beta-propeller repeat protein [Flavobacteriales bacterium]